MNKEENNYIKGRVQGLLEEIKAMDSEIRTRKEIAVTKSQKISKAKSEGEASYKDFKEDIASIHKNHYQAFLYEDSMKSTLGRFIELYSLAKAHSVELDLSEEFEAIAENIYNNNKGMFTVKDNKVVPTQNEVFSRVMEGLEKDAGNEETLKKIFSSIKVQ